MTFGWGEVTGGEMTGYIAALCSTLAIRIAAADDNDDDSYRHIVITCMYKLAT